MSRIRISFLLLLSFLINACSYSQNKTDSIKATTEKFIDYLKVNDTSKIHALFLNEENYKGSKDLLSKDSKLLNRVINKYPIPSKKEWSIQKGKNGENIVRIPILNKEDSTLNLKKFELLVYFLPDKLLDSSKIYNYYITQPLIKTPEKKLILNPTFN